MSVLPNDYAVSDEHKSCIEHAHDRNQFELVRVETGQKPETLRDIAKGFCDFSDTCPFPRIASMRRREIKAEATLFELII
jgi:hypothetical protein